MNRYQTVGMSLIVAVMAARAVAAARVEPIKDTDGNTLAVVVVCDSCQAGTRTSAQPCSAGAEKGWLNGVPCGECMLRANFREPLAYAYDLHLMGKLTDEAGNPLKERFVKLFFPNGWTMRGRTAEDGSFHLLLGATAEKKSKVPVRRDLGTFVDKGKGTNYFAFFLLPESHKPCAEQPAPAATDKQPQKQTKKP